MQYYQISAYIRKNFVESIVTFSSLEIRKKKTEP